MFVAALLFVGALAVDAYILMILIGILHGSWWSLMPTMNFVTAAAVSGLGTLAVLLGAGVKALVD